jgi:hypothetical protein
MAAVCAQWEKANLKLLEHFLFSSGTAQPDQISVNRFFNSLQLVVNSVARHWKYEPRRHKASDSEVYHHFTKEEVLHLKTALFDDNLYVSTKPPDENSDQKKRKRNTIERAAPTPRTEVICRDFVNRQRCVQFWNWFAASFNHLRDRLKNLPWFVQGKVMFVSREQAEQLLVNKSKGTALIRFSYNNPSQFVISWVTGNPEDENCLGHLLVREKYSKMSLENIFAKPKFKRFQHILALDRQEGETQFDHPSASQPLGSTRKITEGYLQSLRDLLRYNPEQVVLSKEEWEQIARLLPWEHLSPQLRKRLRPSDSQPQTQVQPQPSNFNPSTFSAYRGF